MDHSYFKSHESTPKTKTVVSDQGTMSKDNSILINTKEEPKVDSITLNEIQISNTKEVVDNAEYVNEDQLSVVTLNMPIIYGSTLKEIEITNKALPNFVQQNEYENINSVESLDNVLNSMLAATDILKSWALTDDDNTEQLPESKEETSVSIDVETGLNEASLAHNRITRSPPNHAVCQCQTCYNYFTNITDFLQHYWLSCTMCNYTLKNYEAYKFHVASNHKSVRQPPLPISKCTLSIEQPVAEPPQKASSEFQVCESCGNFFTEDVIQEHFLFACPTCEYEFEGLTEYQAHIVSSGHKQSGLTGLRKCIVANYNIIANSQLQATTKISQKVEEPSGQKVRCQVCKVWFTSEEGFTNHIWFTCPQCLLTFDKESKYRRHIIEGHKIADLEPLRNCTVKNLTNMGNVYQCPLVCWTCLITFRNMEVYKKHIIAIHQSDNETPSKECKSTLRHVKSKKTMQVETKSSTEANPCRKKQKTEVICPNCNIYFPNNDAFLAHFWYICRVCNFESEHSVEYRKHLTASHESQNLAAVRKCITYTKKPITCVVCSKTFKYEGYLLRHQLLDHRVWSEADQVIHKCPCCCQVLDTHKPTTHDIKKCFMKHICSRFLVKKRIKQTNSPFTT